MPAEVRLFTCLSDNYGVLLHDPDSGATAAIDAPEAAPIEAALQATGWKLTDILVTHHHHDHTGGIQALKQKHGCRVVAPAAQTVRPSVLLKSAGLRTGGESSGPQAAARSARSRGSRRRIGIRAGSRGEADGRELAPVIGFALEPGAPIGKEAVRLGRRVAAAHLDAPEAEPMETARDIAGEVEMWMVRLPAGGEEPGVLG